MDNKNVEITGADIINQDSDSSYVEGDNLVYTSGEVAKQLNIDRDMVRYYTQGFENYLDIEKTSAKKGAHWRFHSKDIELLRTIIKLRQSGKTVEDIKEYLDEPDILSYMTQGEKFNTLLVDILNKNNNLLLSHFQKIHETQMLLEEKKQSQLLEKQDELIERQEELQKHNMELSNEVDSLNKKIDALTNLLQTRVPEKRGLFGRKRK